MKTAEPTPLVMVIDDVPANLKLLTVILHALGYQVQTFTGGRQAIEEAKKNSPDGFRTIQKFLRRT
jgi:two-component system, cell cycle response regulator